MSKPNLCHVTHCGLPKIDRVLLWVCASHVHGSRNQLVASPALPKCLEQQVRSHL